MFVLISFLMQIYEEFQTKQTILEENKYIICNFAIFATKKSPSPVRKDRMSKVPQPQVSILCVIMNLFAVCDKKFGR